MSRAAACRSTVWSMSRQGRIHTRPLSFFMVFPATRRICTSRKGCARRLDRRYSELSGLLGQPGQLPIRAKRGGCEATLAFIRSPESAKRLSIDVSRIAIGGHSMGAWVAAETLAREPGVLGAVVISAGDMGAIGLRARQNRAAVAALMDDNRESLAGATGGSMADELMGHGKEWSFVTFAEEYVPTDHSWSDHRIALESLVISWLHSLVGNSK